MSLQGNLTDLPFEDLLQVFTLQHKCGVLFISYRQFQAEVCFDKTALHSVLVYQTRLGGASACWQGLEAAFQVLSWPEGEFHFEIEALPTIPRNIFTTADYIILEHYRLRDEQARPQNVGAFRPCLLPDPPVAVQINLELDEWRLLLQINGTDTIETIATRLHQTSAAVFAVLESLKHKGLVVFEQPLSLPQTTRPYTPIGQFGSDGEYHSLGFDAKLEFSYSYHTSSYISSSVGQVVQAGVASTNAAANRPNNYAAPFVSTLPTVTVPEALQLAAPKPALPAPASQRAGRNFVEAVPGRVEPQPKGRRGLFSTIMAVIRGL